MTEGAQGRPGPAERPVSTGRPDRADGSDPADRPDPAQPIRLTAWVHGQVQGVGFRWWTRAMALELGLTGHAANRSNGRVEVVAEGPRGSCQALLGMLRGPQAPGRVMLVVERFDAARGGLAGFVEA